MTILDPSRFEEEVSYPNWKAAMEEDLAMIEKSKTWQLVEKPQRKRIIGVKCIYPKKLNVDVSLKNLKERFFVNDYS